MNRSLFAAILGMTLLFFSYPMLSETRGSVHGKVWDPTEAVIAGATVTVRNIVSGQTWMAQTGQDGEYEIDFVQTGHYALTAEAKGFQPAMQYAIIAAGQRVEVNFRLVLAIAATGKSRSGASACDGNISREPEISRPARVHELFIWILAGIWRHRSRI